MMQGKAKQPLLKNTAAAAAVDDGILLNVSLTHGEKMIKYTRYTIL